MDLLILHGTTELGDCKDQHLQYCFMNTVVITDWRKSRSSAKSRP